LFKGSSIFVQLEKETELMVISSSVLRGMLGI